MRGKFLLTAFMFMLLAPLPGLRAQVSVKVSELCTIQGIRDNQVFGYGLVVGLQGTGDSKFPLALSSLKNLLKNLGMESGEFASRNCASVILTAELPAGARSGDRIDVNTSSIGDAKSLLGGVLVQSSLVGGDGISYVAAQGPLTLHNGGGRGKNVKTGAVLVSGGIVEKDMPLEYVKDNTITLILKDSDFGTLEKIIAAVKEKYPEARPELVREGAGMIKMSVPEGTELSEFIAEVGNIEVLPSTRARVVINEKEGIIVSGGDVKISESMVSSRGVNVKISSGETAGSVAHIDNSGSVKELVDALNLLGVTSGEMILILRALRDSGALKADLVIR